MATNHSVASASPLDYQQTSQGSSHASAEDSPYVGSNDGVEAEDSAENVNGDQVRSYVFSFLLALITENLLVIPLVGYFLIKSCFWSL